MCEVIKKINEDPGFDRALSFIFFQKWLDIVPASADEWPISAMTTQNVYYYGRKPIIWTGNSSDSVPEIIGISNKRPISGKWHFLYWKRLEINGKPRMAFNGDCRATDEF